MLEAINLDVELGRRPVLRDVSIGVGAGEIVALVGPNGAGVVMALHDLTLAANIADRVVVMKDGSVIGVGPPARTLTSPLLSDAYDAPIDVLSDAGEITAVLPRYA